MSEQFKKTDLRDRAVNVGKKALGITARILIELIEQCEDMSFLYSHRWAGYSRPIRADRYEYESWQLKREEKIRHQAIMRLKKGKFIKLRKEGDRAIYELTTSGKVKAIKVALRSSEYIFEDKLCLVSFDFPEASRKARNCFRCLLKNVGFKFVQGSVWSIKRDISRPMNELISLLRIKSWVKVYIVFE